METAELQGISEHFGAEVMEVFDITAALEARNVVGGTAVKALERQVKTAGKAIV